MDNDDEMVNVVSSAIIVIQSVIVLLMGDNLMIRLIILRQVEICRVSSQALSRTSSIRLLSSGSS